VTGFWNPQRGAFAITVTALTMATVYFTLISFSWVGLGLIAVDWGCLAFIVGVYLKERRRQR
jgi:hypothetical protein